MIRKIPENNPSWHVKYAFEFHTVLELNELKSETYFGKKVSEETIETLVAEFKAMLEYEIYGYIKEISIQNSIVPTFKISNFL